MLQNQKQSSSSSFISCMSCVSATAAVSVLSMSNLNQQMTSCLFFHWTWAMSLIFCKSFLTSGCSCYVLWSYCCNVLILLICPHVSSRHLLAFLSHSIGHATFCPGTFWSCHFCKQIIICIFLKSLSLFIVSLKITYLHLSVTPHNLWSTLNSYNGLNGNDFSWVHWSFDVSCKATLQACLLGAAPGESLLQQLWICAFFHSFVVFSTFICFFTLVKPSTESAVLCIGCFFFLFFSGNTILVLGNHGWNISQCNQLIPLAKSLCTARSKTPGPRGGRGRRHRECKAEPNIEVNV